MHRSYPARPRSSIHDVPLRQRQQYTLPRSCQRAPCRGIICISGCSGFEGQFWRRRRAQHRHPSPPVVRR
eukprot:15370-Rhodomonas_salina.1